MNKIETEFIYNDQFISYEILTNGYNIYLGDTETPWIVQTEPLIPFEGTYEESCLQQIEQIANITNASEDSPMAKLQQQYNELSEAVDNLLMKVGE